MNNVVAANGVFFPGDRYLYSVGLVRRGSAKEKGEGTFPGKVAFGLGTVCKEYMGCFPYQFLTPLCH